MDVRLPDGTVIRNVPDGMSKAELTEKLARNGYDVSKLSAPVPAQQPERGLFAEVKQQAGNAIAGAVRGAGSIGATILAPIDMVKDAIAGKGLSLESNRERRAAMDAALQTLGADTDSTLYQGAKLGTEIAGTLGAGGVVANGAARVAPNAPTLVNAIRTGGFRTGAPAATTFTGKAANVGNRVAGGAITGGATAALVNPDGATDGAVIGGILPPALSGTAKAAGYTGNVLGSLVRPFTPAGVDELTGNILRRFADGGPTAMNTAELVPGSMPTLAEASGNAGLATLQRGVRDLRPNSFIEREQANAAARSGAFDQIAGTRQMVEDAIQARDDSARVLYGKAFDSDAMRRDLVRSAEAERAPFRGVGGAAPAQDLATPGLRELANRPAFQSAVKEAKRLAADNGVRLDDPLQSLQGLHYIKLALDDALNPTAKTAMGRNASGAISDMRDKLAQELAQVSPLYGNARQTFSEMSKPINAMEVLQGLKLTDAQGNITLAKVQNALRSLEDRAAKPGIDAAKSVTQDQLQVLTAIRDDLMRQANLGLGKSIGSNTFQNIATDNIVDTLGGNFLTRLADKTGASGLLGQAGRLVYSGPNEAVRNRLVDMALNPELAEQTMAAPQRVARNRLTELLNQDYVQLPIRSAPVLWSSR